MTAQIGQIIQADAIYSLAEAGELLGISKQTLAGYVRDGRLKARNIGRYSRIFGADLIEFVRAGAEPSSAAKRKAGIFRATAPNVSISLPRYCVTGAEIMGSDIETIVTEALEKAGCLEEAKRAAEAKIAEVKAKQKQGRPRKTEAGDNERKK